jgi:hypothetical protein
MPFVDEAFSQSTAAKSFLACGALKLLPLSPAAGLGAPFFGIHFRCTSLVSGSTSSSSSSRSDGPVCAAAPTSLSAAPVSCPPAARRPGAAWGGYGVRPPFDSHRFFLGGCEHGKHCYQGRWRREAFAVPCCVCVCVLCVSTRPAGCRSKCSARDAKCIGKSRS